MYVGWVTSWLSVDEYVSPVAIISDLAQKIQVGQESAQFIQGMSVASQAELDAGIKAFAGEDWIWSVVMEVDLGGDLVALEQPRALVEEPVRLPDLAVPGELPEWMRQHLDESGGD